MRARKIRPGMLLRHGDSFVKVVSVGAGFVLLRGPHSVDGWLCPIWPLLQSLRSGRRAVVDVPCGPCGATLRDYDQRRETLRCPACGTPHSAMVWSLIALVRRGKSLTPASPGPAPG